jgi:GST-like protein
MADATDQDPADNQPPGYVPPRVWTWDKASGGQFANINRPVSGATHEKALPVGKHKLQLYSLGTPNGVKVTIMLEELLAAGHADADYDAWLIRIGEGDQFGSGFVALNPNSKIPAMMDHSTDPPTRLFESGSILVYLAEKFGAFLPSEPRARAETFNWLMWQMGSAPFVGGGFGHFYHYAPFRIEYAIDRYAMETKRQLHVLDTHLADHEFLAGQDYTIADMATFPWYGALLRGAYNAAEFLSVQDYPNVARWAAAIWAREPVQRGRLVNAMSLPEEQRVPERHEAADIDRVRASMRAAEGEKPAI